MLPPWNKVFIVIIIIIVVILYLRGYAKIFVNWILFSEDALFRRLFIALSKIAKHIPWNIFCTQVGKVIILNATTTMLLCFTAMCSHENLSAAYRLRYTQQIGLTWQYHETPCSYRENWIVNRLVAIKDAKFVEKHSLKHYLVKWDCIGKYTMYDEMRIFHCQLLPTNRNFLRHPVLNFRSIFIYLFLKIVLKHRTFDTLDNRFTILIQCCVFLMLSKKEGKLSI